MTEHDELLIARLPGAGGPQIAPLILRQFQESNE